MVTACELKRRVVLAPLVRWGNAGRASFHGEHVDRRFGRGEEAAEAQEGADGHSGRRPAILHPKRTT